MQPSLSSLHSIYIVKVCLWNVLTTCTHACIHVGFGKLFLKQFNLPKPEYTHVATFRFIGGVIISTNSYLIATIDISQIKFKNNSAASVRWPRGPCFRVGRLKRLGMRLRKIVATLFKVQLNWKAYDIKKLSECSFSVWYKSGVDNNIMALQRKAARSEGTHMQGVALQDKTLSLP